MGEDNHAPSLGDGEDGSQHAEHSIDVRPCDRDGGQQGVQVVRYVEGVRKFLDLNKCSERRDDAEGEDDDLLQVEAGGLHLSAGLELLQLVHNSQTSQN